MFRSKAWARAVVNAVPKMAASRLVVQLLPRTGDADLRVVSDSIRQSSERIRSA